jgi:hypothetical protein
MTSQSEVIIVWTETKVNMFFMIQFIHWMHRSYINIWYVYCRVILIYVFFILYLFYLINFCYTWVKDQCLMPRTPLCCLSLFWLPLWYLQALLVATRFIMVGKSYFFLWDNDACFVLDQHVRIDFYGTRLLTHSAGRHGASLEHIIQTPKTNQPFLFLHNAVCLTEK